MFVAVISSVYTKACNMLNPHTDASWGKVISHSGERDTEIKVGISKLDE